MNPIYTNFHKITLKQALESQDPHSLVRLFSNQTTEDAVRTLSKGGVLSAPVVDPETCRCIGMVDMLDIVNHIVKVAPDQHEIKEHELRSLEIAGRAMAFEKLSNIVDQSQQDPYLPLHDSSPSTMAINYFAKGIHRVPIFEEDNVIGTVSQSLIVKLLAEHLHEGEMKVMGSKTAKELGLGQGGIITIGKKAPVIHVIRLLNKHKVSAVALIEEDGRLAGNFSATDLKGLYTEQFPSLLLSAEEYLSKFSPNSLNTCCCTEDSTLISICKDMINSKVHRLWVLNGDFKPIGVVSMTDIMKVISEYSYN